MRTRGRAASRSAGARPALTGRALFLGVLVVLLVVVLAAPINRYLGSRSDVAHSAQQLHGDRAERAHLKAQKARYADPGYIEQQARIRLQYAMPGDRVYVVTRDGQPSAIESSTDTSATRARPGQAWTSRLWNSIRAADR